MPGRGLLEGLVLAGCVLLAACSPVPDAVPVPDADLAIRDVTVVDVNDGTLHAGQTVLVEGNRIVAVGPASAVAVPADAVVVEGAGRYLIPGLWDAHVHSATGVDWHFPLFLAHGVTSVRNMHSTVEDPLALVLSIKQRLADGTLHGPRLLANGGIVDGDPPVWPGSVVVRDAEEARQAVDRLADGGADFIKVYDNLLPQAYFALMERAKERGIPVDGHLPWLVPTADAAAAGQRTFEHTDGMSMGCASEADAVRAEYSSHLGALPGLDHPGAMDAYVALVRRILETRDPELCRETARSNAEHGVAAVPTLVMTLGTDAQALVDDPEAMGLLPEPVRAEWREMAASGPGPFESLSELARETVPANVRLLDEAGVVILAGTDVGNPFLVPGLSLHRELERLNEVGLSPLKTLQAATILPARVFGLADSRGTVEAGKFADLVVLDADPLERVSNVRRIHAVIADGRLYRRADLDGLLAGSAQGPARGVENQE